MSLEEFANAEFSAHRRVLPSKTKLVERVSSAPEFRAHVEARRWMTACSGNSADTDRSDSKLSDLGRGQFLTHVFRELTVTWPRHAHCLAQANSKCRVR